MVPDSTAVLVQSIYSPGWWIRHYAPARTPVMREKRAEAIRNMGLAIRHAFNSSEDFEPLLTAIVDSLNPRETRPF